MASSTDGSVKFDTELDSSGFEKGLDGLKETVGNGVKSVAGLAAAAGAVSAAVISVGKDTEQAMNQVEASTGLAGDALKDVQDIANNVYSGNFGESMQDAADATAEVYKQTKLVGEELQKATESSFLLKDTFGYETQESTRAAKALMDNFGISAEDAYNLIAQGAQNGLDKNGDLLDTLNEYSVHYAQMGYSAEEFFGSLQNGTASGTFSVDKLGDAMKEFGIRAKDTADSTTEGFTLIGLDADAMREKFAAGGDTAKQATQETITALNGMSDEVSKNQAGVDLFGTMWEDLGGDAVNALMNTQTEISATTDALGQMNDIKYDDIGSAIEGLKRTAETELLQPLAKKWLPKIEDGIEWVSENLDVLADDAKKAGKVIGTAFAVKKIAEFGSTAAKTVKTVTEAVSALGAAANPAVLAATAIVGIGAALTMYIKDTADYEASVDSYTSSIIDKQSKLSEQTDEITDKYNDWADARGDATGDVEQEFTYYDRLYESLGNIVDENGKIKDGYENRAKVITGELSEALGIEISIVDGQIQKYDELGKKIEDVMATKKANAMLSANEDAYMDAQTNLSSAAQTYTDDLNNQKSIERRLDKANSAMQEFEKINDYAAGSDAYYSAVERFVEKFGDDFDFTSNDIFNQGAAVMESLQKTSGDLNDSLEDSKKNTEEALNTVIGYQSQIKNYEDLQVAIASGNVDEIDECNIKLQEGLITAETGTRETLQRQMDNAQSSWQQLQDAYNRGEAGITKSMVDSAHQTYVMSNQQFNNFNALASIAADTSARNFITVFSDTLNANVNLATDSVSNLIASMQEAGMSISDVGREIGMNYAAGVAEGIDGNTLAAEEASKAMYNQVVNTGYTTLDEHSPSKVGKKQGAFYSEGVAIGVKDASGEAINASEMLHQGIVAGGQIALNPWNAISNHPAQITQSQEPAQQSKITAGGGNWTFPVYLSPNQQVLDTIIISAKDRANAVSGGEEY